MRSWRRMLREDRNYSSLLVSDFSPDGYIDDVIVNTHTNRLKTYVAPELSLASKSAVFSRILERFLLTPLQDEGYKYSLRDVDFLITKYLYDYHKLTGICDVVFNDNFICYNPIRNTFVVKVFVSQYDSNGLTTRSTYAIKLDDLKDFVIVCAYVTK